MLSYEEFVELGTIETSSSSFAARVREVRGREVEWVKALVGQELVDEILGSFAGDMEIIEDQYRAKGFGYLSSSLKDDLEREAVFSSLIASTFMRSGMGVQPLIISIEDFYEFMPQMLSFVAKTTTINDIEERKFGGSKHVLIVSGFSGFELFSEEILEQVPSQEALGLNVHEPQVSSDLKNFGERFLNFAKRIGALSGSHSSLKRLFEKLAEAVAGKSVEETGNLKILFATCLLLQDRQTWQTLWYEGSKTGVPLYIVAPESFHSAMNRVNEDWGHGDKEYRYRAQMSLGISLQPPFDIEDGQVLFGDSLYEKARIKRSNQGMSSVEVLSRLDPVLRKLEAILSLNPSAQPDGGLIL